jgi:hypothetical protein
MSQAQADRITNTLLPELVKQGQERNTADDQRISEQTANAEKEYNAGETRLGVDSRKSFTEAMKTLSESADKAALSLTQAALEYETAIDKWQLSVGAMTEAEYQKRRMETISSTANVEKFDLQHKYDEQVQAANDKRDKTQTADQTLYDSMKDKYAQQYGGSALTYLVDTLYKKLAADFDTAQDRDRQEQNEAALSQDRGSQTLDVKTMTATFEALMAAHESTAIGAIDKVFDEFEARSNDLGKQVHEVLTEAINGVNDALVKMMTEQDHRGVWKDMGKSLFTGVAKTGLQDAEGFGMKALGLGTKVQHVIVDNHDQIGISSGNPLGSKSTGLLGWANNNNFMSSLFGGKLFGAGSIFGGGMANGGVLSPGDFYMTGEQGPELLQVGSTSKINNARDTSAMLSTGSGSGSPVHNWNIDARGATDPAATYQAAQRAIMAAAPHIVAASNAAQKDQSRRRPSSRS